jgi:hypothetical protein
MQESKSQEPTRGNIFFHNYRHNNNKYAYLCPVHTALQMVFSTDTHPDVRNCLQVPFDRVESADKIHDRALVERRGVDITSDSAVLRFMRCAYQDRHLYRAFNLIVSMEHSSGEGSENHLLILRSVLTAVGEMTEVEPLLGIFIESLGPELRPLYTFHNDQVIYYSVGRSELFQDLVSSEMVFGTPKQKFAFFSKQHASHLFQNKSRSLTEFIAPLEFTFSPHNSNPYAVQLIGGVYFTGYDYSSHHFMSLIRSFKKIKKRDGESEEWFVLDDLKQKTVITSQPTEEGTHRKINIHRCIIYLYEIKEKCTRSDDLEQKAPLELFKFCHRCRCSFQSGKK